MRIESLQRSSKADCHVVLVGQCWAVSLPRSAVAIEQAGLFVGAGVLMVWVWVGVDLWVGVVVVHFLFPYVTMQKFCDALVAAT